jgi:hypothetical protein
MNRSPGALSAKAVGRAVWQIDGENRLGREVAETVSATPVAGIASAAKNRPNGAASADRYLASMGRVAGSRDFGGDGFGPKPLTQWPLAGTPASAAAAKSIEKTAIAPARPMVLGAVVIRFIGRYLSGSERRVPAHVADQALSNR